MAKYFFANENDEYCYQKQHFLDLIDESGGIEVFEAVPIQNKSYFYCKAVGEVGEKGNCGKGCGLYAPKNGKSGCCKHVGQMYEHGEKTIIREGNQTEVATPTPPLV